MDLARSLILIGLLIIAIGIVFIMGDKIPFIGRLPGDIRIEGENTSFYIPVMSCILISLILTGIMNVALWFINR